MENGKGSFARLHAVPWALAASVLLGGWMATGVPLARGQELDRKAKVKTNSVYPELARQMKISGVVKLQVTVAANGSVKSAKLVGGHPLLAGAALDAVRKWRFEAGQESTGVLEFRFEEAQ